MIRRRPWSLLIALSAAGCLAAPDEEMSSAAVGDVRGVDWDMCEGEFWYPAFEGPGTTGYEDARRRAESTARTKMLLCLMDAERGCRDPKIFRKYEGNLLCWHTSSWKGGIWPFGFYQYDVSCNIRTTWTCEDPPAGRAAADVEDPGGALVDARCPTANDGYCDESFEDPSCQNATFACCPSGSDGSDCAY